MSLKRKLDEKSLKTAKKHTLDSDEEDSDEDEKNFLPEDDIEGEEDGIANIRDDVKITPFNMREELEEGHFDREGHFHWRKEAEIKDNWLDNIDWVKIKNNKNEKKKCNNACDLPKSFNINNSYAQLLTFMNPNETIQNSLQRLAKNRAKLTTAERLRQKKLGIIDETSKIITNFTEVANEILTNTGNMDIYQETFEQIQSKLSNSSEVCNGLQSSGCSIDMYSDDFIEKEKETLYEVSIFKEGREKRTTTCNKFKWEFKWKQNDSKLNGPYSTEQMLKWAQEKYFKEGVYVRKVGELTNFYSSNRIDFDLYN